MTNDVTIKQSAYQKNPIAIFVRDIIAKNKNRMGINLPIVIDFVDIPSMIGNITKPNEKYYYVPISKNETVNAVNPLKTKTKSDDIYFEYNILASFFVEMDAKYPLNVAKYNNTGKYLANLFNNIKDNVTVVKHDRRFHVNQKELDYIVSRIKYYKTKMNIRKPIIFKILDIASEGGDNSTSLAYTDHNGAGIIFAFDYNMYNENRGNIIGNKGLDMFILHELTHTKIPYKYQMHGKEFKKLYKKYALEITQNKKLIDFWSKAGCGLEYLPDKSEIKREHTLNHPIYSKVNLYIDVKSGFANFNINRGKFDSMRSIKNQNREHKTHFVYVDIPEFEKIKFMNYIKNNLSQSYITDDEYNVMTEYYIYTLYKKYGDKKYLKNIRETDNYKQCMKDYKKVSQSIENKNKQYKGKSTKRVQKSRMRQNKFKL